MKKISRIVALALAFVLAVGMPVPVLAATNPKTESVSRIRSDWTDSTKRIDWKDDVMTRAFVESLVADVSGEFKEARAVFNFIISNVDYSSDVKTQRTYSELMKKVAQRYVGDIGRPSMNAEEISVLYVGMLRTLGIPAYVESGTRNGWDHAWVVTILSKTKYWNDPARAESQGSSHVETYYQMSANTYRSNYWAEGGYFDEGTKPPSPPTPAPDPKVDYAEKVTVAISSNSRWQITVPIPETQAWNEYKVNVGGFTYGSKNYLPIQTVAAILDLDYEWRGDWNTVLFEFGDGAEKASACTINKTAQAYKTQYAWVRTEWGDLIESDSLVFIIDGQKYVCPEDIRDAAGIDGVNINWKS